MQIYIYMGLLFPKSTSLGHFALMGSVWLCILTALLTGISSQTEFPALTKVSSEAY